ncbi:MAG: molybdopterin molybdotransferase MoeA [Rhodospirillaceae bacterium]|jgi:molybdopterin molybdotransferase|nr:molybdopterin molybdotransferase MoeA [Rhodospirillaceae bacterium]MBT5357357.1 molybdopterin molybdotransferase MoeA [Rhodospirillaceae bacterium]MBT5769485.1 molybdopterin molybdotransferase MoeA [Rhodospirillaceae bacterium]MBT6311409.1 molybdopterin molybdotransferase MoeA [Rhodospirillaceae bacterium]MBT7363557.1 molybdopterin molybdotransferase MoeA [Rhodospirillaceae bacterium]
MAQLSDDCFEADGGLIPVEEALARLEARLSTIVGAESITLDSAAGRILAADITSDRAVPPHDNSAVDGYAVYFDDLDADGETRLPVAGRVAAGHPLNGPAQRGTAVRIFTGAPIPDGAAGPDGVAGPDGAAGPDTVLMQEDCRAEEHNGQTHVVIPAGISRGANRRDEGEDVARGQVILRAGQRLRPQDIGLAASIGRADFSVYEKLTVGVLSTGDEVYEPGAAAPAGGIYDANRHALTALLSDLGCAVRDYGIVADDADRIGAALTRAAEECDAIVSTAGMSVGDEDHLADAIARLGTLHFWKVAIKPGRPVAFGQIGDTPFIGLPGNPAAMMVTFLRLARPALLRLGGATDVAPRLYQVRAGFTHSKKERRREYVRVCLAPGDDGVLVANKHPRSGAGVLTSMVESEGLVELPEDMTQLTPGTMVSFLPFTEVAR